LEAGAPAGTPIERLGCGPFNRDDWGGLEYGSGFSMDQSHLSMHFGYNNICAQWDYSPAREIIAMYFPLFEYSLVIYVALNLVAMKLSYEKGEIPEWYWNVVRIVSPICIILSIWFRMIFVGIAYESVKQHTLGFLGLQIALLCVAVFNVLYIKLTRQSYPSISLSASGASKIASIYLYVNLVISVVKIFGTIYIVSVGTGPSYFKIVVGGQPLGFIIDIIWMIMNAILPVAIAYIRLKNEDAFTVHIIAPPHEYEKRSASEPEIPVETTPLISTDPTSATTAEPATTTAKPATTTAKPATTTAKPAATTAKPATTTAKPAATTAKPAATTAKPTPPPPPPVKDPNVVKGKESVDAIVGTETENKGLLDIYGKGHKAVEVQLEAGASASDIFLPKGSYPEGSALTIINNTGSNIKVHGVKPLEWFPYMPAPPEYRTLEKNQKLVLKVVDGEWKYDQPKMVDPYIVQGQANLDLVKGNVHMNSGLSGIYERGHKSAEINVADGSWISNVYLTKESIPEGAKLTIRCNSSNNVNVQNLKPENTRVVSTKQRVELQFVGGEWKLTNWVDEKGKFSITNQANMHRYCGSNGKYFLIVSGNSVVHQSADLEDCKKFLKTKYGREAKRPSRMICELASSSKVIPDPHSTGGQNQGGGFNAGFNKYWVGWPDIKRMQGIAENYLKTHKIDPSPKNDNLLEVFNPTDYKDVVITTNNGAWMRELILPSAATITSGSTLTLICNSGWGVKVTNAKKWTRSVTHTKTMTFKVEGNDWK